MDRLSGALPQRFGYDRMRHTIQKAYGGELPPVVQKVLQLAVDGHLGQPRLSRSGKSIPFIVHPVGVALLVIKYYSLVDEYVTDDMDTLVCVALAHDLIEDTRVRGQDLELVAGQRVRTCVEALTKPQTEVKDRSSADRARMVMEHVCSAGTSALFVKACDILHNLSRPEDTPEKLYKKSLAKAWPYAEMLSDGQLGREFAQLLQNRLEEAASLPSVADVPEPIPNSLEAAIAECVRVASSKVVERHDLPEIICRLAAADSCVLANRTNQMRESEGVVTASIFDGRGRTLAAKVEYSSTPRPDWISAVVLSVFLQILVHRLTVSEADTRADLGLSASRHGLIIDVETALRLGVNSGDFERLAERRARCRGAVDIVQTALDILVNDPKSDFSIPRAMRIESRVKEAQSIMNKFLTHRSLAWPNFDLVEDIAGVRLIAALPRDMLAVDDFVQSGGMRPFGVQVRTRTSYYEEPTASGYQAIHYSLGVQVGSNDTSVPCELQLRTMFQDVWAQVSHESLYKADRRLRRKYGPRLHEMGALLVQCETTAQEIMEQVESNQPDRDEA